MFGSRLELNFYKNAKEGSILTMKGFENLGGKRVLVTIQSRLFGTQRFDIDKLQIVNDSNRIGIKIKNQQIFVWKENGVIEHRGSVWKLQDKDLEITIVTKL